MTLALAMLAVDEARAALRRRAEREMQPYLGVIHELDETVRRHSIYTPPEAIALDRDDQVTAYRTALDKALELLGVQR